ncbi:carboxymuconolactone decarboxylase family protein [Salsuginibacillus kocurii]|uniref:carboxymuconolactone decarboxylase family protein n=1 Tax=Salsuginibacillus kocurii TaxID=427078 RepID=UPI00035D0E7E|nr:carboxymuconolactone decarboxylase family protein [Salsuginibacillus kocurii]
MTNDQQGQSFVEEALHDYKEGMGDLEHKMPKLAKQYKAFTDECFKEGKLSKKTKQLIALAVSIEAQDEYCMIYHTKGSLDEGCSEDELLETIGVASAFGGGAAMSQAVTVVQEAMQTFGGNQSH